MARDARPEIDAEQAGRSLRGLGKTGLRWIGTVPGRLREWLLPKSYSPEPADVPAGRVLLVLGGWLGFVAATLGAAVWFVSGRVQFDSPAQTVHPPPAPQLQTDPPGDLARMIETGERRLSRYAWHDREAALVEIPIERAMALVVARGRVAWDGLEPAPPSDARTKAVEAAKGGAAP